LAAAEPGPGRATRQTRHAIIDRDGVLNRERAEPTASVEAWEWEAGAIDGLRMLADRDIAMSVVTNQSAIGRGDVDPAAVARLHEWLDREITGMGVRLVGIFVCPHAPRDRCACRKPQPALLLEAMARGPFGPDQTVTIGDDLRDIEAGLAAGTSVVLVRTGKGAGVTARLPGEVVVATDLAAAVAALP
jgi:D-glycero-D-manno-heptose 1,7-bisphosphate phosphatase